MKIVKSKKVNRVCGMIVSWESGADETAVKKELSTYSPKQNAVIDLIVVVRSYLSKDNTYQEVINKKEREREHNKNNFLKSFAEYSAKLRVFFDSNQEFGLAVKEIFDGCGMSYTKQKALQMREAGLFLTQADEAGVKHKFSGERQIRDFLSVTKNTRQDCDDGSRVDYSECVDAAKKLQKVSKDIPVNKTEGTWKSSNDIKKALVEHHIGEPEKLEKLKKAAAKQIKKVSKVETTLRLANKLTGGDRIEFAVQFAEKFTDSEWTKFCETMGVVQAN